MNMSLHPNGFAQGRACGTAAGRGGQGPATPLHLRREPALATRRNRERSCQDCHRRPLCTPRGPAPRHIELQDHSGSSPAVTTGGARWPSSLGGRHLFHQALNDRTDRLKVVVHRIASLISVEPAKPPSITRLCSRKLTAPVRVSPRHDGAFQWTRSVPPEANL